VAEIVGALGYPHNPFFPLISAARGPGAAEIDRLYGTLAEHLRAMRADTLVVFTTDHYNLFFEACVPIFSIGVAESAPGPCDYPQLPQFQVAGDPGLARELQAALVGADFDVGVSQEYELDHTVTAPLGMMLPRMDVPLVPFFVSTSMQPRPSAARCLALGRAVGAALRARAAPGRVVVLASGAFSFEVGGPRMSATSHIGVPDPAWVEHVTALLGDGRVEQVAAEITPQQLERAGNASGEILNWLAMLGTFDPRPPDFIEAQPDEGHTFAAWSPA
jgi:gallate dioxygenase